MTNSSLATTGKAEFKFDEFSLSNLARKLVQSLSITLTLSSPERPHEPSKKVRVVFDRAISPNTVRSTTAVIGRERIVTNLEQGSNVNGISRAQNYMSDIMLSYEAWVLIGEVDGGARRQIAVIFIPKLGYGTYSFRKPDESINDFDPSLN